MSSEMDWSPDFCLGCDKQATDGSYCSQACRLADLEKAGASAPATPLSLSSCNSATSSWTSSALGPGLYLPPAVDFSAYKSSDRVQSPPTSPLSQGPTQFSYFSYVPTSPSSPLVASASSNRGL
ncbi:hypothetical protein LTR16_011681, partial [Cryomyces antarcticus]